MKWICCLAMAACIAACGEKENGGGGISSLDAPVGLKVNTKTTHSAVVVWDAVSGAENYEWKLEESGKAVQSSTTKNTNIIIDKLTQGSTYQFQVRAFTGDVFSEWSRSLSIEIEAGQTPENPDNPDQPDQPDGPNNPDQPNTPDTPAFIDLPDEHFRAWVLWNYDADRDGRLSAQEAAAIRVIELNTDETASLEGIQHFPALVKIHAEGSLNGGNPKGRLTTLDLSGNPRLDMLYLPHNQITSLDLSPVPLLTRLEVPYNLLTSIDLSHLPRLNLLSLSANRLTSLDTRGLNGLDELHCDANPLTDLQLDNAVLRYLDCSGTLLTVLDLRKCPKLNVLDCTGCPNLTTVRLSRGQVLGTLRKDDHTTLSYE